MSQYLWASPQLSVFFWSPRWCPILSMDLFRHTTNPSPPLRFGVSPLRKLVGRVSCLRWIIEVVGERPRRGPTNLHRRQLILSASTARGEVARSAVCCVWVGGVDAGQRVDRLIQAKPQRRPPRSSPPLLPASSPPVEVCLKPIECRFRFATSSLSWLGLY